MRIPHLFVLSFGLSLLFACQAPCVNQISIFDESTFDDPEYQKALKEVLQHAEEHQLRFYIRDYLFLEDKEFLVVKVHGPKVCAIAHFLVEDPRGIVGVRNHLAKGYNGAELKNFSFLLLDDERSEHRFVYDNVAYVQD
jgi:hypothetical protein